ncbi:hypothetical protein TBLA_0H02860 [Henningerozyma blattae CBS 6284]|uniref:Cell wall mannoprotein PIR1-like C-terminal domain-containing protein n=1 Tax=Henningerozyma blattae (strain ATCC 34711 / CBS 6284 / DSM 70876 / NBRC 10599 / NRRL Y-10934 / UCD 77-7) TaxID=1071380 RepID=I2H868_HENB6|nr:hypothetical protein TBLA_0H02860 [Tetrapisispora blattae CBS 6284]CCH62570.1 hypothetical protein TBLA_0H02860 [Tetrapisispora blattae CBS 6284]
MQYRTVLSSFVFVSSAFAAYKPSEPWSTLTPNATYTSAMTDYTGIFGIAVLPLATSTSTPSTEKAKRDSISQTDELSTKKTTTLDGKSSSATTATSTSVAQSSEDAFFAAQACMNEGTLAMTLKKGILLDSKGRVGSIVANRQFQFDGPPPQAGAIYAAGWSITPQGNLAIGANDVFYQCLSGNFYNLYDESQGKQCTKVYLQALELINC